MTLGYILWVSKEGGSPARTRLVHSFNHRCALSTVSPPHRSFSTLPVKRKVGEKIIIRGLVMMC